MILKTFSFILLLHMEGVSAFISKSLYHRSIWTYLTVICIKFACGIISPCQVKIIKVNKVLNKNGPLADKGLLGIKYGFWKQKDCKFIFIKFAVFFMVIFIMLTAFCVYF